MDSAPPTGENITPSSADQLPDAAVALATRFFEAARQGQMDMFEQALPHGLPANLTNGKGDTLLMLASYYGHAPLVSLLLKHGADPNRLNDRQQSPLAGVVFKNEKEVIDLLLEAGADPELGQPSAIEATRIFKQEEYESRFQEKIERLRTQGARANNGN
ncbi:hypothetical protein PV10_02358 [Exophiala mesophila]|uniref:Uncharacterized protein n=1 Tax=Exophiala mesophila TaxID=212818 RepID=A0A0D1Y239_EXOME|nr:uncharacterized protein PV10_02358 [Exophiala mesophila]KIV94606.1 hypothetical protein PV10_02358 [Exophiala mesophila]